MQIMNKLVNKINEANSFFEKTFLQVYVLLIKYAIKTNFWLNH